MAFMIDKLLVTLEIAAVMAIQFLVALPNLAFAKKLQEAGEIVAGFFLLQLNVADNAVLQCCALCKVLQPAVAICDASALCQKKLDGKTLSSSLHLLQSGFAITQYAPESLHGRAPPDFSPERVKDRALILHAASCAHANMMNCRVAIDIKGPKMNSLLVA